MYIHKTDDSRFTGFTNSHRVDGFNSESMKNAHIHVLMRDEKKGRNKHVYNVIILYYYRHTKAKQHSTPMYIYYTHLCAMVITVLSVNSWRMVL